MKVSMILAWCLTGATVVLGLIFLVIFALYHVDGTLTFACALGDQGSCQSLQLAQDVHVVVGLLGLACIPTFVGFIIWASVATGNYTRAEEAKEKYQQEFARWWWSQRRP